MLRAIFFLMVDHFFCLYGQVFKITGLNDYLPGKSAAHKEAFSLKGYKFYKTNLIHLAYKFPMFLNISDGLIQDFYIRFPSFISHDAIYNELIDLYGMPKYVKDGRNAIYLWENDFKHIYSATCTLTCFPLFYTVFKKDASVIPFFALRRMRPLDFLR
jgi:hypothetical protein